MIFIHLNLKDEIRTDGHLGQKGTIDLDLSNLQITQKTFSRAYASEYEIYNNGLKAWKYFMNTLEDESLRKEKKIEE